MVIEIRSTDSEDCIGGYYQSTLHTIEAFRIVERASWFNIQDVIFDRIYYDNGDIVIIIFYQLYYKRKGWNIRRAEHLGNGIINFLPIQELFEKDLDNITLNVYEEL